MSLKLIDCDWKSDVERLAKTVLRTLGHKGWSFRWVKSEAYCWRNRKIIDICSCGSKFECLQMMLHEIAHIDVVELHGSQHTRRFWIWLEELVEKYLGQELSARQMKMATFCQEFIVERTKR